MRTLQAPQLERALLGLLHHLRGQGGIFHDHLPAAYVETAGKDTHAFKRDWALPTYGRSSPLPELLTDKHGEHRFETWGGTSSGNWYNRWVRMALHGDAALGADPKSFYPVLLPGLAKIGLLREGVSEKGDAIWGLEPDALVVTDDVVEVGCTVCSHRMYVAKVEAAAFEGVPCLTHAARGTIDSGAQGRPSYFSNLYRAGDLERIC